VQFPAEFAQGELFEILEDDQSLPEDVVQVGKLMNGTSDAFIGGQLAATA
jgi:hypothetical protein